MFEEFQLIKCHDSVAEQALSSEHEGKNWLSWVISMKLAPIAPNHQKKNTLDDGLVQTQRSFLLISQTNSNYCAFCEWRQLWWTLCAIIFHQRQFFSFLFDFARILKEIETMMSNERQFGLKCLDDFWKEGEWKRAVARRIVTNHLVEGHSEKRTFVPQMGCHVKCYKHTTQYFIHVNINRQRGKG